jgi:hypothetical protein
VTDEDYDLRIRIARQVVNEEFSRLYGRLFGALESFGLPDTQEKAAKQVIRLLTNDIRTYVDQALKGDYDGSGLHT